MDSGDTCHGQFPLLAGKGHYYLLCLVHIKFQAGVITPFYELMKSCGAVDGLKAKIGEVCHQQT